ncbi:hypothetical protein N5P37_005624 [Trichoderma harzianum]|uniref:Ig-like domain-containing protein n=1 Tax=Trichoderma harzianum CBS 226.95 TaxID=983964 RepID=A0A2T3ZSE1_TRIHA|nr:hypothetical protein M431DRAFT_101663 [Trichoderma harzianum CBS 226.95]KAK0762806.1 hypothetical protein N5P37_005624 [Trichoderma harzianum]PKK50305.1 hypothetical protein CI102_5294 [Trichoderma harzianum]PTB47727.1 hypothetical protein M431DRAFT_101663 [Trichoderma harzianum CBS 226.95]
MKFSSTLLLPLVALVAALPSDLDKDIVKRSGEGVHLDNCSGPGGIVYSEVTYWSNDADAVSGHTATDTCTPTVNSWKIWEGSGSCKFSDTGVTFSWSINSNAGSYPSYQKAGSGGNGARSFTCYKDDGHGISQKNNGVTCKSIYYCI